MVRITRVFDAPRPLVFRAWTDPAQLLRWFAPGGCEIRFTRLEVRQGGTFHSCLRTPNGYECWCKGTYLEIVEPERIVYTLANSDPDGNDVEPTDVGMHRDWPKQTVVTVTFADIGGKTELTLHQTVSESLAKQTGAHPSWLEMLDRLADDLAKR
jgi:uncharacterized protein YndB with AHSA1/START domain